MDFHEKAHFVKADVAAPAWSNPTAVPFARYASIRTFGELTLCGSPVHYEIRLFG
jgi:hypothetical protein